MRERLITALLLGAVVVGILVWMPAVVAVAVVMAVVLLGAWEWAGFARLATRGRRSLYVVAIGAAIAAAWWCTSTTHGLVVFLWLTALWWLVALLWLKLGAHRGGRVAAAIVGFPVLVPAAIGLARLVMLEPDGRGLLLFLLVLIAAADVGAYFGGRSFGRHKLAPHVSPGKTWEGLAAGMVAAAAAAALGARLFEAPLAHWLMVCVAVALVSVVGDLVESMWKRRAGLKDSGNLLPGHGGILDRIDSLTAAGPAFLLGLHALGLQ